MVVSYTDGQGTAESVTSGGLGPVDNVNDAPTGGVTISGIVAEDQTLDGGHLDARRCRRPWHAALSMAARLPAQASSMSVPTRRTTRSAMPMSAPRSGWWSSYTDGQGTAESVTSGGLGPVDNVNDAPTGGVTISGIVAEDQTSDGGHSRSPTPMARHAALSMAARYWLGFVNVGADQATYTLGDADVGAEVRVVVSYTDGQGTAESVTSGGLGRSSNVNDAPPAAFPSLVSPPRIRC